MTALQSGTRRPRGAVEEALALDAVLAAAGSHDAAVVPAADVAVLAVGRRGAVAPHAAAEEDLVVHRDPVARAGHVVVLAERVRDACVELGAVQGLQELARVPDLDRDDVVDEARARADDVAVLRVRDAERGQLARLAELA